MATGRPLFLSEHAEERVWGRTRMRPDEVARALNVQPMIFTGYQCEDNRAHIIFYSPPDFCCFFAVVNMRESVVVTILTLAQYRDRYGAVDGLRMEQAEARALGTILRRDSLLLTCRYVCETGVARMRNLGRVDGMVPGVSPKALARDEAFVTLVRERCATRGVDFASVLSVQVRTTQDAPGVDVPLDLPGADATMVLRWRDSEAPFTESP